MTRFSLLILSAFFSFTVCAQPAIQWQKAYGSTGSETINDLKATSDGGCIFMSAADIADGDISAVRRNGDIWIVKVKSTGAIDWQKCYGGDSMDNGYFIETTGDGGYILGGFTMSVNGDVTGNPGGSRGWIAKLTATGVVSWQKLVDSNSSVIDLVAVSDGYVYISVKSVSSTNYDIQVVKINSTGNEVWRKTYGGSQYDVCQSIRKAPGGFIVCGSSTSKDGDIPKNNGGTDICVMKLDEAGNLVMQANLGGSKADNGISACPSLYGGYIVAGYTVSGDGDVSGHHMKDTNDAWVVKISETGNIEWQKPIGGIRIDYGYQVIQASNGNYVLAGYTVSTDGDAAGNHGLSDMLLVGLYPDGSYRWKKVIGSSSYDGAYAIAQTSDGGFLVGGSVAAEDGDAVGSGLHKTTPATFDCWLVKLGSVAGIGEIPTPDKIKVYPTVTTGTVFLSLPAGYEKAEIKLINMMGQAVTVETGGDPLDRVLHLDNVPAGNYVLRVLNEGQVHIEKIVVCR